MCGISSNKHSMEYLDRSLFLPPVLHQKYSARFLPFSRLTVYYSLFWLMFLSSLRFPLHTVGLFYPLEDKSLILQYIPLYLNIFLTFPFRSILLGWYVPQFLSHIFECTLSLPKGSTSFFISSR